MDEVLQHTLLPRPDYGAVEQVTPEVEPPRRTPPSSRTVVSEPRVEAPPV
jgi:hypothetical protein